MLNRRDYCWILTIVTVVAVILTMNGLRLERQPYCRVVLEAPNLLASPGNDAEGLFEVHNTGKGDLTFKIKPTCACTKILPPDGTVAPGEKMTIAVRIPPLKEIGAVRSVQLDLSTNEVYDGKHRIAFTVDKTFPWLGEIRNVSFGVVPSRKFKGLTHSFELSSPSDETGRLQPVLTQLGPPAFVTATVVPLNSTHWKLEFHASPDTPVGQHSTKFAIGTDEHPEIAIIPVWLRICENVSLRPAITLLKTEDSHATDIDVCGVECDIWPSMITIAPDQDVWLVSTQQISADRVRASLEFGPTFAKSIPNTVRIDVGELGTVELLCIAANGSSKRISPATPSRVDGESQ